MQGLKLVAALVAAVALTAFATATAFAIEPEWLPGAAGTVWTGATTGKLVLQLKGGGAFECEKATATGELLSKTNGLGLFTISNCTAFGLAALSLGDPAKTILVHVELLNCFITTSPLVGAILIKTLLVHVEIPTTGLLILLLESSFVAKISPKNTRTKNYTFTILQTAGVQEVKGCLNEAGTETLTESLLTEVDAKGGPLVSGVNAVGMSLTFTAVEQTFDD